MRLKPGLTKKFLLIINKDNIYNSSSSSISVVVVVVVVLSLLNVIHRFT